MRKTLRQRVAAPERAVAAPGAGLTLSEAATAEEKGRKRAGDRTAAATDRGTVRRDDNIETGGREERSCGYGAWILTV